MKVKIVVFTPIDLEFASVAKYLTESNPIFVDDALYQQGYFKGKHHEYNILVCETGAKVANMAVAAERAISFFQPSLSFLVGIAGSLKDALIRVIVVGTKAYAMSRAKKATKVMYPALKSSTVSVGGDFRLGDRSFAKLML